MKKHFNLDAFLSASMKLERENQRFKRIKSTYLVAATDLMVIALHIESTGHGFQALSSSRYFISQI